MVASDKAFQYGAKSVRWVARVSGFGESTLHKWAKSLNPVEQKKFEAVCRGASQMREESNALTD
jgi:hypothetical protein